MRIVLKLALEVPDDTDPQRVASVVNHQLDSAADGGGLVQFGDWDYEAAQVVGGTEWTQQLVLEGSGWRCKSCGRFLDQRQHTITHHGDCSQLPWNQL